VTVLAGMKALADDINAALASCIGGEVRGSDTSTISTVETSWATTGTSSLSLAAASTYQIEIEALWFCSVANDDFTFRVRDTNTSGSIRMQSVCHKGSAVTPYTFRDSFLWTTTVAETKKWVATVVRNTGTGNITIQGGSFIKATYIAPSGRIATI
jgi:hypothetical protein